MLGYHSGEFLMAGLDNSCFFTGLLLVEYSVFLVGSSVRGREGGRLWCLDKFVRDMAAFVGWGWVHVLAIGTGKPMLTTGLFTREFMEVSKADTIYWAYMVVTMAMVCSY